MFLTLNNLCLVQLPDNTNIRKIHYIHNLHTEYEPEISRKSVFNRMRFRSENYLKNSLSKTLQ